MKKLNITKKQYDESKYFNKKYGALKFVSESGKLYKTDKGVVLALESAEDDDDEPKGPIDDLGPAGDGEGDEEVTVKKDDLATALQGVIDTVKDIAADNDVTLPEEEEDGEGEPDEDEEDLDEIEFDEGNEDVCPKCGAPMKKECSGKGCIKKECGGVPPVKKECKGPGCTKESTSRVRRAKLVREALARRARAKKVRESIERRRRARKVLESIRKRRMAKKVLESARRRRLAKKVMESRRLRASRARRMMESRRIRARRARMAK
jgi:hypothetical protein